MKKTSSFARPAALSLALAAAFPVLAQTAAQDTLAGTTVTATRTPTRADALVSEVVVIDREQIEKQAGRTLPEILARSAGVQFASNGGRGTSSSVFIRGAESRHTILLIDGVRYGSATLGTPIWDNIPLDSIERIEVLKGPASSLYGSDAVGGVVQIFTRRGQTGVHPSAYATLGTDSFSEAGGGISGGNGLLSYALNVRSLHDKGFSATNPRAQFGNHNPDRDGFHQNSMNASLGVQFAPDWKLDLGALYSDGLVRIDDGPGIDARTRLRTAVGRIGVEGRLLPNWTTSLRYASSADTSNGVAASFGASAYKTTQDQWTWQNQITTGLGTVVAGVERLDQRVDSSLTYAVSQRDIDSVFAGLNGSAGRHSWQVNVRRDRNSQFGTSNTGFAGYGFAFTDALRANVSHGTSFTAPSFNQLYYPGFGTPTLQPERGRNTDLGLTWSQAGHTAKLVRFDNKIRGFIPSGPLPLNVPRARIDGWTLGYDGSFGPWTLRASLDVLDPRNEVTRRQLPRRSKQQASAGLDYAAGAWTFGGTVLSVGDRFDDAANNLRVSGYTTLDLNAGYAITRDVRVNLSLVNVTDRQYESVLGYNQPGRGGFVTLRWQPK